MKISLMFLQNRLSAMKIHAEVLLNNLDNPMVDSLTIYNGQFVRDETLYFCPAGTSRNAFLGISPDKNMGLVWVETEVEPPKNVPVLWLKNVHDNYETINKIMEIFHFYQRWGSKVRQYMLEQRSLKEIFALLEEVTPNPYYLCDCSFRMQVIRKVTDMEEMSIIWRYQYNHGHLPIQLIMGIEENGMLDLMNKMRKAVIISKPAPFGFPFVSKTIHYSDGIMGHFYILGTYTKLSVYEVEIADFFGNLLIEMLKKNSSYLPTMGRFYDNYFVDLIEGIDPYNLEMLEKVFQKIHWDISDTFYLAVLWQENDKVPLKSMLDLQIQALESHMVSKAFLYGEKIVVLIDISKMENRQMLSEIALISDWLQNILNDFGGRAAGISESFSGIEGFEKLKIFYQQGCKALQFALRSDKKTAIIDYSNVAIDHLCEIMRLSNGEDNLFMHPAIKILRKYDGENGAELIKTLEQYLICGGNVVRTAKALFIHRNSLMYRLDKIQQLTGLDLLDVKEKVRLFLTLYIVANDAPDMTE